MAKADVMVIVDKTITKSARKSVAIAAAGTSFTFTFEGRGVITRYLLEAPNVASITFTLSLVDENSVTIFTGSAHAENANHSVPCDVEIDGRYTVTLTLSDVAGGSGGTAYVTFWLSPVSGNSRLLHWFDQAVKQASSPTFSGLVVPSISPAANFVLTQNSVNVLTSVGASAVVNTLYLKEGKVGIGTTTPVAKLEVYEVGDTQRPFSLTSNSSFDVAGKYIGIAFPLGNIDFYAFAANNVGFKFQTWDSGFHDSLVITGPGKVGIGDMAPGELLDVAGNINCTGVLKVDDVQVVGNRVIDARIDDTPNSGDATTDGIIAAIQAILTTHGLAAAA